MIKLKGKTKKGKERVKRDGSDGWQVTRIAEVVAFDNRLGPWWHIKNESGNDFAERWIHSIDDKDFEVIK